MRTDEIASRIEDKSPVGIASAIALLIRTGDITPGTKLPTVRALGATLGVSPATVSHAWQALTKAGLVQSRGRSGTSVLAPPTPWLTPRSRNLASRDTADTLLAPEGPILDLSTNIPDPQLLPEISASWERIAPRRATVASYLQPPLLAELESPLRQLWPYDVQALSMVDGAMDAVDRALRTVTRFGDRVIVENPTFPLLLDLLEYLHLRPVPVRMDQQGMLPSSLHEAMASRPAAMFMQPRAHNPTGAALSAGRAEELAQVILRHRYGTDMVIVEDDHSGAISTAPAVSLGTWIPHRVIHVLGFSKSHGPDLRLAAIGGPSKTIERITGYRVLGPGWSSRMMQALLHDMLTTREPRHAVQVARHAYYTRQRELVACLKSLGVTVAMGDGLNVWLPVMDEQRAKTMLAAHGIAVAGGTAFAVRSDQPDTKVEDHLRISVGHLRTEIPRVAQALAAAAHATPAAYETST